ncbi:tryptophan-rich sensory protein [Clostridium botulinum]|uniref:TspO n=2 Tax=Clostridium botulinum TaxID=1491 RepID=A0A0A0ICW7_CLOBO|nr:TspO/MBR family protein [Clostridium botulinum]KEI03811.1 TspO [Clostridium botulinum C/D str. BKT75002]KEI09019.1 TspO [Clostridium botulinum C/D str. BKT2873]KGM93114.1 TspO [Clostridium botulinum D str. CCUG 7971]KGM99284.1 TspO [Clostridium botulinum C/D str. DC5]KOC50527.1 TspO protein [Clostridium botulinum]
MKNIFKINGKKSLKLILYSLIITYIVPFIAVFIIKDDINIYNELIKPSFAPPSKIFPIIWGVLYFSMAIAFYRILLLESQGKNIKNAKRYYLIQLFLNFIWIILFFKLRLFGLAFIEILILLIFILLTTFQFYNLDKLASFLTVPYIIWVCFAGVLNFYIWVFNEM